MKSVSMGIQVGFVLTALAGTVALLVLEGVRTARMLWPRDKPTADDARVSKAPQRWLLWKRRTREGGVTTVYLRVGARPRRVKRSGAAPMRCGGRR